MNTTSLSASIKEDQKAEATRIITDAARKAATAAINRLAKEGAIESSDEFQKKVIESPDFAAGVQTSIQSVIESELVAATRSWREKDGVIYFTLVSDGTTGPQWVGMFPDSPKWTKDVLLSPDFKPTKGVVYRVAVLKGTLFSDNERATKKIRTEADKRKLSKPNAELVCLIREKFTDKEIAAMGLIWIVAMHEPVHDSDGDPRLLSASRGGTGQWLDADDDFRPDN